MATLRFHDGSLLLDLPNDFSDKIPKTSWDPRVKEWRAKARDYAAICDWAADNGIAFTDQAKAFKSITLNLPKDFCPREEQSVAHDKWRNFAKSACICLPTGGGKTILAMMAMASCQVSTLIVVPTKDLMHQWAEVISRFFGIKAGLIGDGSYEVSDVSVATYQSARIHIERFGNAFGFLIFDECHHLPGQKYQRIALASLAPYRLGLSATLERSDGKEALIYELVGPLAHEAQIAAMIGSGLSPFDVVTKEIELTSQENEEYLACRKVYLDFVRQMRINFSSPRGFSEFVFACSRSEKGALAMRAFRRQKQITQTSMGKLKAVWELIQYHSLERIIIFTDSNEQAYTIGRLFLLPVITHQTPSEERKRFLQDFKSGQLRVLLSSKVLNEGVDVPEASVAIVVSGSSVVREHVQRLGRILRQSQGKRAVLYELVSEKTSEYFVSQRRRQHNAYQRPSPL